MSQGLGTPKNKEIKDVEPEKVGQKDGDRNVEDKGGVDKKVGEEKELDREKKEPAAEKVCYEKIMEAITDIIKNQENSRQGIKDLIKNQENSRQGIKDDLADTFTDLKKSILINKKQMQIIEDRLKAMDKTINIGFEGIERGMMGLHDRISGVEEVVSSTEKEMSDLKEALRLQRKELDDMRVHFTEMEKRKKKRRAAKGEFTKLDIANAAEKGARVLGIKKIP